MNAEARWEQSHEIVGYEIAYADGTPVHEAEAGSNLFEAAAEAEGAARELSLDAGWIADHDGEAPELRVQAIWR